MSDTETMTLFDQLVELTGLEPDGDETNDAFKVRMVRHFADAYPNTDEGNAAFEALNKEITDWVDAATEVQRENRGARRQKPLPDLDGLDVPVDKPKRARAAKTEKSGDGVKAPTGRKFGSVAPLAATFEPAPEDAHVSKRLTGPLSKHGYKRQKERSPDGHIVYHRESDGHEVHVGQGKGEKSYMMGWRPAGAEQHGYGGDSLDEYLKG